MDAAACRVELKPMIAARHNAAFQSASAERRKAVRASIVKRARVTFGIAEDHDRLIENVPSDRLTRQIPVPTERIPSVMQESHFGHSLRSFLDGAVAVIECA